MAYFRLNTSVLADGINKYKNAKGRYTSDLNSTYNMLKNTDAAWNDANSKVFIKRIKEDKYKLDNYASEIEAMYQEIETLKNSFDNLFASFGCRRGSILRFDDAYYHNTIRNLDNANEYLNRALAYVNSCNFKADFPAIYQVYALRNEITKLKTMITNIKNSLTLFKNKTNKILADAKEGLKTHQNTKLDIERLTYNWSAVDIEDNINL